MSFAETYLAETARSSSASTALRSSASPARWRPCATRGGRLFLLGRRRLGRARKPRRERLPQALRVRGLRADRQRLRADGPDQRRGLGQRRSRPGCEARGFAASDAVLVFSVGGGDAERNVSANLVRALELAQGAGAGIFGDRRAATVATPRRSPTPASSSRRWSTERVTPHTEGLCAVVWHLLVSHPALQRRRRRSGSRCAERPRSLLPRRRSGLHRQPLRRPPARPSPRPSGSPSTTTSPRAGAGTSRITRATSASSSSTATSRTSRP